MISHNGDRLFQPILTNFLEICALWWGNKSVGAQVSTLRVRHLVLKTLELSKQTWWSWFGDPPTNLAQIHRTSFKVSYCKSFCWTWLIWQSQSFCICPNYTTWEFCPAKSCFEVPASLQSLVTKIVYKKRVFLIEISNNYKFHYDCKDFERGQESYKEYYANGENLRLVLGSKDE